MAFPLLLSLDAISPGKPRALMTVQVMIAAIDLKL
jgi:hypothetical protein